MVRVRPPLGKSMGGGIDLPCGGFLMPSCLTAHPAHAAHAKTHMPAQLHAHACTWPHMPKKVILVEVFACTCLRMLPHMPHSPPRTCPHSRTAHAAHAFGPTWAKCIPMGFLWVGLVGTRTTKIGARSPQWSPKGKKQSADIPNGAPGLKMEAGRSQMETLGVARWWLLVFLVSNGMCLACAGE